MAQLADLLSASFGGTMSNPIGDDAQSAQDEKGREVELLCLKIKAQLEDLFSDSHLAEDGFLLKHVMRTKHGFVNLKLLTSSKKIKALTTDWCVTRAAAERSELLEVNDECTKVRRREPLPEWLLCSPTSKHLLAWNISAVIDDPERPQLSEKILQKFSAHGSIASSWILHPGEELPKKLQHYAKIYKELRQDLYMVVRFDHLEDVRKAFKALKAEEERSNGEGLRVETLGFKYRHCGTKDEPPEEKNKDQFGDKPSQKSPLEIPEDLFPSPPVKVSNKTPDTSQPQKFLDNAIRETFEHISCSQAFASVRRRYSRRSRSSADCDKKDSRSPWVLRRKFAADALNPKVAGRVLRQPLGPDGTKGFQSRREAAAAESLNSPLEEVTVEDL